MSEQYILQMKGIRKAFPGVLALNNVSLNVRPGTVHALMGENGAGKSTLMKCLFGIYHHDAGEVIFHGKNVAFTSVKDALDAGISMIHQELSNVPNRTVAQNMWMGREPLRSNNSLTLPFINHKKVANDTAQLLKDLGWDIDANVPISSLSISQQQGCEIAKAVSYGASLVVMDEPTSSLSEKEVEHLFKIINDLRARGIAIIYISHRMEEIFKIADDITVMRDGTLVGTYPAKELDKEKLISLMIGRVTTQQFPAVDAVPGEVRLKVSHMSSVNPRSFQDVSFELHKSEILGVGGLVGAQRSELMEALFGLRNFVAEEIVVNGKSVTIRAPRDAIKNGMGLITEDRRGTGIFPVMSVLGNTSVSSLSMYESKFKLLKHKKIQGDAKNLNSMLRTKTPSLQTQIQNLSGGNQQKVILSRWLMTVPDILIMDEPTRGIDVGAKYEIYTIMADLVKQGKSIIMISSELPELLGMSHRVMVLCNGRVTGFLDKKDATQEAVMRYATQFS